MLHHEGGGWVDKSLHFEGGEWESFTHGRRWMGELSHLGKLSG